jgi:hypothetical protein
MEDEDNDDTSSSEDNEDGRSVTDSVHSSDNFESVSESHDEGEES